MPKPFKIKLDRERELRFDHGALSELSRVAGVNANDPSIFRFPLAPHVITGFVWAGQLHEKNPLPLSRVAQYLPVELDAHKKLSLELLNHVLEVRGVSLEDDEEAAVSDEKPDSKN